MHTTTSYSKRDFHSLTFNDTKGRGPYDYFSESTFNLRLQYAYVSPEFKSPDFFRKNIATVPFYYCLSQALSSFKGLKMCFLIVDQKIEFLDEF